MAYIPGFTHDIFISYSHVDNILTTPKVPGWVDRFHKALETKLAQRFGRYGRVAIWRDEQLTGDQLFDQVIQNRINTCAVFLALYSYGHKKSDYCHQEVTWFSHKAGQETFGLHIGERTRFFNVLLYNISPTEWPGEFGRTSGFRFYDQDSKEPLEPDSKEFNTRLRELVEALHQHLKTFRRQAEVAPPPAPEAPKEHYDVFLAEVADSLRSIRQRIASDLTRQGIKVYSKIPPPHTAQEHEQAVQTAMEKVSLTVHLLDEWAGAEIVGDDTTTYLRKQVELGLASKRPQLIWVPSHLELDAIADEQQKALLLRLQDQPRESAGNFIRPSPTQLPEIIIEKLRELAPATASTATPPAGMPPAALLDTHIKDQLLTIEISKFLLSKKVLPYINPQEDDPRRNIDLLKERLKQVRALVIFYGQVSEDWVRERFKMAMNIIIEEGYPVTTYGIYLASPGNDKGNLNFGPGLVLDNINGFNPASVLPLLDRLGVGGGQ